MEQLNKVELRGLVGSSFIKDFESTKVVNFSVATNYCYHSSNGETVIETTWHRVVALERPETKDAFQLSKGSQVHVLGRLRTQRFTGADGTARETIEILANTVDLISK